MPISAALPPPSVDQSANASDSDPDPDPDHNPEPELDDDEEYEEIEIEEEIEVEEEVSEEEEVEEDVEEVEEEEKLVEEEVEEAEEVQEEEDPEEEEFGEDLSPIGEDHGRGKISHMDDESKAPLLDSGIRNADPGNPLGVSGKDATAAVSVSVSMVDGLNEETNDILYPKEENKRKGVQYGDDISQMEPRLDVSIRPRSLSPGVEIREGNKRPAVICDFFAKGWCIKGNSCRFLHIRDNKDVSSQQKEGSVASANLKSEPQGNEGLIEGGADAAATSERIPPWDKGESPSWKSEFGELHLHKDNPRSIFSLKAVGKESLRQNWYLDKSNSPIGTNNSFHGTFSSSSAQSKDIYGGDKVSSYAMNSSQLTAGILQSNHGSVWTRPSLSFSSSSWSTDPLGTLRHLDDDRDIGGSGSASLQRSSSPFSGSESENLSRYYVSGDMLRSARYKTKFSSSDWEPSIPFRPSFSITQRLLTPASQYDPIRDSIEQPNVGDKFSRFSSSSQGTSILSKDLQRNMNTVLTGTFGQEFSSDTLSRASPQNFCDSTVEKKSPGNDLFTSQTDTAGIAVSEQENKNILAKEDKLPTAARGEDMKKASEVRADRDFFLQKDGSRHKEMKVDGVSQNNEVDFDIRADGTMQRESKALKFFRAALIDFVKELIKPTWREGNLSKDAHKLIVKKTVDKVLGTLPPHQIPSTPEYVEMYLCLSQPKIAKLVEVYVDKYGKS